MNGLRRLLKACVLAWVSVASWAWAGVTTDTLRTQGLSQPVEIRRDYWGISHIYARNEHDLFFAQGFNAARDRLFQLEIWRRRATGTMAEIQGRKALQRDIGARLLKFRGDMEQELQHYHPRGSEIIRAFCEGVNAYIALTERKPELLPLPFRLLGIKPGRWTPEIVVSRHNGLFRNIRQEVQFARLVNAVGSEKARQLLDLHPGNPSLQADKTVDLSLITPEVLQLYTASRTPVQFTPDDVLPSYRSHADLGRGALFVRAGNPLAPFLPLEEPTPEAQSVASDGVSDPWFEAGGSNNWAVTGRLTFSGHTLLANDPHRRQQAPSLRYWVHLVAPGWNVIGAGEPALPGVSIGHNEVGAWGLTVFPIDQEDLYVYDTNPADPLQYRYRGRWQTMTVLPDTIRVKGEAPVAVRLKFTRHGPVLYEDRAHHKAYALRAAWLEIGAAPYLASLRMDQAGSWEEFRQACSFSRAPSENMVWADVNGNIGWQAVGIAPIRRNWSGLLPVPGDGRYEWDGYVPIPMLPHRANPPEGWLATANQDNVPQGYPVALGYLWADPYRFARVAEVLAAGRRLTLADMMRLQQDELSLPARSLVPLLRGLQPKDRTTRAAMQRLLSWDGVLDKDSVPAAIYVMWKRRLRQNLWKLMVPEEARQVFSSRAISMRKMVDWLTSPDGRFGPDPTGARDALVLRSLKEAVAELRHRLGKDMRQWRYGQKRFKHVLLRHPLSEAVRDELRRRLDVGPLPRGGDGYTVNSTSNNDNQVSGASFRIIADTGDWDRSLGTNTPGQSGDPDSPHYRDLFQMWADGKYFPVAYSRAKVESVTESVTLLLPER